MRFINLVAFLLTATLSYAQDNIVLRNGDEIPAKVMEIGKTELKYRKAANPDGPVYAAPMRDVLLIKYANGTKDTFGSDRPVPATVPLTTETQLPADKPTGTATGVAGLRYHGGLFGNQFTDANGQSLSLREVHSILYSQPNALTSFDRGRSLRTWSVVTAIPAVALIGTGIGLMIAGGEGNGNEIMPTDPTSIDNDGNQGTTDMNRNDHNGDNVVVGAALAGSGVLLGVVSVWLNHRATIQFRRAASRYTGRATTSLQLSPASRGLGAGLTLRF